MQLIAQAAELGKKGSVYEGEGNYDYAANCYKKVVLILSGVIQSIQNDKNKAQQIQDKIDKYKEKFQQMTEKQKQKAQKLSMPIQKGSKLGFPTQKIQSPNNNLFDLLTPTQKLCFQNEIPNSLKHNYSQDDKNNSNNHGHIKLLNNSGNVNEQYKNMTKKKILQQIEPEIRNMIVNSTVTFKDIIGMQELKKTLEETIIRPRKRPDLYSGIRAPPKGILLYGPPGNGKTYICKALANQSGCTFFALSASSIMNKLVGETEKMLKRIFDAAYKLSPSIIFIDEIDSILTSRSENENQASRRLKTEFLVLLDGMCSPKNGQILLIGATNLPKQLDLAARRRFNKLIYIGMPDKQTCSQLIEKNLSEVAYKLSKSDLSNIVKKLDGYSASEITNIVKQVCMIPLRQVTNSTLETIKVSKIRQVNYKDFCKIIEQIPPLLTLKDLEKYNIKN